MIYGKFSPQEYPLYSRRSVSEALRMPYSTLYSWLKSNHRESVISASDPEQTLNFLQLSEAFAINYMRKNLGISLHKIREASQYLGQKLGIPYPLVHSRLRVGTDVYFEHAREILLNATRYGQVESVDLIGRYISRIEFSEEELPDVLYPWIPDVERRTIRIDPRIRFGQPTITGTGISVTAVQGRFKAGESPRDIADSYGIRRVKVEDAIAYATC